MQHFGARELLKPPPERGLTTTMQRPIGEHRFRFMEVSNLITEARQTSFPRRRDSAINLTTSALLSTKFPVRGLL